ncbi:thioredoxin family protein [Aureitalea marina]|uniref:Thioredoxin domain-containing protein n=1 Tax=Aureitalea marina TaxID=930804 RepID=A0A2S7KSF0_9FLAO|nr:thioredoxin family protein [Aureitalea marina]PQB05559.1 hypothetical protein BST85_12115 [Aureitalea marina]
MRPADFILLLFLLLSTSSILSQELETTTFTELEENMKQDPRPVLVFLYTDWCKFCTAMKKSTFKEDAVIKKLNQQFYYVPFNGESREDVVFLGARFRYQSTGLKTGIHQLAEQLGTVDGQLTYPVSVILNQDYEIQFQHNAFLGPDELLNVLQAVND